MDIKQAIAILDFKLAQRGGLMLEMLTEMLDDLEADALSNRDAAALRVFLREGRKLFAPV
jgi:hypothetical protein